jgi:hypothetical protein
VENSTYLIYLAIYDKCPDKAAGVVDGWIEDIDYSRRQLVDYIRDYHPEVWQMILPNITALKLKGGIYETE